MSIKFFGHFFLQIYTFAVSFFEKILNNIFLHIAQNTKANAKLIRKECEKTMASNNKSSLVPEAREALNKFKMEAASEVGVNLKQGYNGDLTSKQAGSVGGQMVNIICPEVRFNFIRKNRNTKGHQQTVTYNVTVGI